MWDRECESQFFHDSLKGLSVLGKTKTGRGSDGYVPGVRISGRSPVLLEWSHRNLVPVHEGYFWVLFLNATQEFL